MTHTEPKTRPPVHTRSTGLAFFAGLVVFSALRHLARSPSLLGVLLLSVLGVLLAWLLLRQDQPRPLAPAPRQTAPSRPVEVMHFPPRHAEPVGGVRASGRFSEKAGVFRVERDAQGRVLSVQNLARPGQPKEHAPENVSLEIPRGMQWPAYPKRKGYLN